MNTGVKNILLVEDEAIIAMMEKMELAKYGYSVIHAFNGEDAVRQALNKNNSFDVILMDIDLGSGIDGTQAAESILKDKDIPIVFVSSHTEREIVEKTEKITSYGYVVKNSGIVILDTSIKMAMKLFNEKMERRLAEKAMREGDERLQFTLGSCHIGTWDVNLEDKTAVRSLEHAHIFGYETPQSAWSLEIFLEHVLQEDRAQVGAAIQQAVQTQNVFNFECRIHRFDGQVRWIWVAGRYLPDSRHLAGILQDITEHKSHEAEIERLSRLYAALSQINQTIVRVNSYEELTHEVPRVALEFGGFEIAWVGRYNTQTREVTPMGWAGEKWKDFSNFHHSLADDADNRCLCVPAIQGNCSCVVNDLTASPEFQVYLSKLRQSGIRAAAVFPIRVKDVIWGVFALYDSKPDVFQKKEIALLEEAAMDIGYAIEHIDNEIQRKQAENFQALSNSILAILNKPLTLREISNTILGLIKKATGLDAVGIRLKDGDDFPYFSEEGLDQEFLLAESSVILRSDKGGVCRDENVTAAGSIWTNDSLSLLEKLHGTDPRLKPRDRCAHEGFMSIALIPIRTMQQQVIGLLHLNDRRKDRFTPEMIGYFEGLTASFGIAVERKLAEDEIKKQLAEKEILLLEIHHRIKNNMTNLEALLLLQTNSTDNTKVKAVLQQSIGRLHSIRVLYDKILLTKDYQNLSIKSYVEDLIDSFITVYAVEKNITIENRVTDFNIVSKKAVSIGIIINELLSNVFKYAFADGRNGIVSISIDKVDNTATLVIKDNGIGIDEKILSNKSSGLGLTIVKTLADQLEGTYSTVNDNGTKSIIRFAI